MSKHDHMTGLVLNSTLKCKAKNKHSPFCTMFCSKALVYIHCLFAAHIHTNMTGRPAWQPMENGLYRKWPGYTSQLKHEHEWMPVTSHVVLPIIYRQPSLLHIPKMDIPEVKTFIKHFNSYITIMRYSSVDLINLLLYCHATVVYGWVHLKIKLLRVRQSKESVCVLICQQVSNVFRSGFADSSWI